MSCQALDCEEAGEAPGSRMPLNTELIELSARIGNDPMLVQGAGGNTSIKQEDWLWVKASGKWLAHAGREEIFVPLRHRRVIEAIERGEAEDLAPALARESHLRPSIETTLHALMPHPVVIHVHSVHALACLVRKDGETLLASRLKGMRWAWVPYRRPGMPLTRAVRDVLSRQPDFLLLQNHGVVIGGSSCGQVDERLRDVERRLHRMPRAMPAPDLPALQALLDPTCWRLPTHVTIHSLAVDRASFELALAGALYPDHVVFLGVHPPPTLPRGRPLAALLAEHQSRYGCPPAYVLVEGKGVFVSRQVTPGAEAMLLCQALLLSCLEPGSPVSPLSETEAAELLNWEAERFRQATEAPKPAPCQTRGMI